MEGDSGLAMARKGAWISAGAVEKRWKATQKRHCRAHSLLLVLHRLPAARAVADNGCFRRLRVAWRIVDRHEACDESS